MKNVDFLFIHRFSNKLRYNFTIDNCYNCSWAVWGRVLFGTGRVGACVRKSRGIGSVDGKGQGQSARGTGNRDWTTHASELPTETHGIPPARTHPKYKPHLEKLVIHQLFISQNRAWKMDQGQGQMVVHFQPSFTEMLAENQHENFRLIEKDLSRWI